MDDTVRYLTGLKKKYVHQVEHIIDDWDFQSLPPDSRRPFLEEEIISEIVDDVAPEMNAISSIHASSTAWFGLSLTQELTDLECNTGIEPIRYQSYEQHLVSLCTRPNGVTGVPEPEFLDRFVQKSSFLNVFEAVDALFGQLDVKKWQVRCKALVLMKVVLLEQFRGGREVSEAYLRAMRQHPQLLGRLHRLCVEDRNARVRDEACKLRALIQVSGEMGKSAVGSEQSMLKNRPLTLLRTDEAVEPFKVKLSPRVAVIALASWKRNKQYSGDRMEMGAKFDEIRDNFQAVSSPAELRRPEVLLGSSIFRV